MAREWDYVVVGGGSAGCTLAGRLSENPNLGVLLVEAGGWDRSLQICVPGFVEYLINSKKLNWRYSGEPDPSLGGRPLTWAAGRVIGGSSSINGMVYGRGLPGDYDRWVQAGAAGWSWNDLLPYFKRMEAWRGPPNESRGLDGPLAVRRFEETDPSCASTIDALVGLGVPAVEDYCAGIAEGVGLTQATQKGGWRHSAAHAYLHPALRRPNLTVLANARATNLLFDGSRCIGARVSHRGETANLYAARETVVACGAIGSPKLLMLSGIGDADSLRSHGVAPTSHLPGVGSNLNDHVNVLISAFVDQATYNTKRSGLSALREGARLLGFGSGAASSPANHAQAFVRTDDTSPHADVQLQIMPLGFGTPAEMRRNGITVVVSPCRPEARGRVSLRSADPTDPPKIEIAMLSQRRDRETLLRGCKLSVLALAAGPLRQGKGRIYSPPAPRPGADDDWMDFVRRSAALNWHPTSTCRMGAGQEDVVDADLLVHGLTGVSVADASIMPNVTSGNTNAPVIAIAERAAELIKARTP